MIAQLRSLVVVDLQHEATLALGAHQGHCTIAIRADDGSCRDFLGGLAAGNVVEAVLDPGDCLAGASGSSRSSARTSTLIAAVLVLLVEHTRLRGAVDVGVHRIPGIVDVHSQIPIQLRIAGAVVVAAVVALV